MFDEAILTARMNEIGYRRVDRHIYRADWSSEDVEHFIYFSLYGTPNDYLAADFGLRNQRAQTFAQDEIRRYGGPVYQLMKMNKKAHCSMNFPLGSLASWGPRSSLRISSMSNQALVMKIIEDIKTRLLPLIRNVTSIDHLSSFLCQNAESHAWLRSNGAIRAGMIIELMLRTGISVIELEIMLEPYHDRIASNLLDAQDPDPSAYVKKVIDDAISIRRRVIN